MSVPVADCTIVDAAGRRVVEPGEFELLVGPSSREDVLLTARFSVSTGVPSVDGVVEVAGVAERG